MPTFAGEKTITKVAGIICLLLLLYSEMIYYSNADYIRDYLLRCIACDHAIFFFSDLNTFSDWFKTR